MYYNEHEDSALYIDKNGTIQPAEGYGSSLHWGMTVNETRTGDIRDVKAAYSTSTRGKKIGLNVAFSTRLMDKQTKEYEIKRIA